MQLTTKLVSSLEKIFPDEAKGERLRCATLFKNEPFSFQVAYKNAQGNHNVIPMYVRVESNLDTKWIREYAVGYVPVLEVQEYNTDENFERKTPGLYPDLLLARHVNATVENDGYHFQALWVEQNQENLINSVEGAHQSLWFTVNENSESMGAGKYIIKVLFYGTKSGDLLAEEEIELVVLDAELPKQSLIYTSWFHCDCLADIYGVEIFSDRFFEIFRSFVSEAAKTGMNMILLPAFTPPLDTSIGKERKTAQLVSVEITNGEYHFDFSLMRKYIEICRACGIEHFEHNHLFTQWGAKFAPKIMAIVDGEYRKVFGWETDATSEEYAFFLKSYLRAFKRFMKEVGLEKNIMFHISDEPGIDFVPYYKNAQNVVGEEIQEFACGDAISHFDFYREGNVKRPIVSVASADMDKFIEHCDDYWVYYTGGAGGELSNGYANRIIPTTSARNRVIGLQMYVGGAKGFLHWGYNYYYGVLSHGLFNPMANPCGYNQLAGTSYVVYPDIRGFAVPSLRMKVMYEGFNDYRALQKLESHIGRPAVLSFIRKTIGEVSYRFCPSGEELLAFRQKLNKEIINTK